MTFSEVRSLLRRRWWVIVLVAATAALAALGYSLIQPPLYRATAQVLVLPPEGTADPRPLRQAQLGTLRAVLLSFPENDPDLPPGLAGRLHVGVVPDEGRLVIEVDDGDPQAAARLANDLAARLLAWVEALNADPAGTERIAARLLVSAGVPGAPIRPRTGLNTGAGAVLGLLLSLPLAFLWDALGRER